MPSITLCRSSRPFLASLAALFVLAAPAVSKAEVVFSEDFSSAGLSSNPNGYLGGWFGNQVSFGQWVSTSGPNTAISAGQLHVESTAQYRSAGIVLDPVLFAGAGDYQLTFDLAGLVGDSGDSAFVRIWSGAGYVFGSSPNALIVDTYSAQLTPQGAATSSLLASGSFQSTGNGLTLNFTYDGFSAVALFFGSDNSNGYPHLTSSFDNIHLATAGASSSPLVTPEPRLPLLTGLGLALLLLRRRR